MTNNSVENISCATAADLEVELCNLRQQNEYLQSQVELLSSARNQSNSLNDHAITTEKAPLCAGAATELQEEPSTIKVVPNDNTSALSSDKSSAISDSTLDQFQQAEVLQNPSSDGSPIFHTVKAEEKGSLKFNNEQISASARNKNSFRKSPPLPLPVLHHRRSVRKEGNGDIGDANKEKSSSRPTSLHQSEKHSSATNCRPPSQSRGTKSKLSDGSLSQTEEHSGQVTAVRKKVNSGQRDDGTQNELYLVSKGSISKSKEREGFPRIIRPKSGLVRVTGDGSADYSTPSGIGDDEEGELSRKNAEFCFVDEDDDDKSNDLIDDDSHNKHLRLLSTSPHSTSACSPTVNVSAPPSFPPFREAIWDRASWLVGLLFLQSCSSFIIQWNNNFLQNHMVIVQFLTMLVGAGGNAGNQASVRVIRGLAVGSLNEHTIKPFLVQEAKMAIGLSALLGLTGFIRAAIFQTPPGETIAVTASLCAIVAISVGIGSTLPLGMKKIGIDPAHSSTTIQVLMDIFGVLITVSVSSAILGSMFFKGDESDDENEDAIENELLINGEM